MISKPFTLLSFFLFFFIFHANAQQNLTIQSAIEIALKNNIEVRQSKLNESSNEINLKISYYALLPSLSTSPNAAFNFGRNIDPLSNQYVNERIVSYSQSFNSQVILFAGFQKIKQIAQNKMLLENSINNTTKVKNDLTLSIVTIYIALLAAEDLIKATKEQIDNAKLTTVNIKRNISVGYKIAADLSLAESQEAALEFNLASIQNQLDDNMIQLKQAMGIAPSTKLTLTKPDIEKVKLMQIDNYDIQKTYSEALEFNADVKIAEVQKKIAKQNIEILKGGYYPKLSLFGSIGSGYSSGQSLIDHYQTNGYDLLGYVYPSNLPVLSPHQDPVYASYRFGKQLHDNFNQSVGLNLQIPIFNNYQNKFSIKKAEIDYENNLLLVEQAKNNLNRIISQAVSDFKAAMKKNIASVKAYTSSADALKIIKKKYEVGQGTYLDFDNAQISSNKAQYDMIESYYELIFKNKVIDFYLGKPLYF